MIRAKNPDSCQKSVLEEGSPCSRSRTWRLLRRSLGHVRSVGEADNADRLESIRDSCHLPHQESLALKAADAVEEQKSILPAMHVRKKGAQDVRGYPETLQQRRACLK